MSDIDSREFAIHDDSLIKALDKLASEAGADNFANLAELDARAAYMGLRLCMSEVIHRQLQQAPQARREQHPDPDSMVDSIAPLPKEVINALVLRVCKPVPVAEMGEHANDKVYPAPSGNSIYEKIVEFKVTPDEITTRPTEAE